MVLSIQKLKSEEIKKMSFEDIFLTPEYKNYLIALMNAACMRVGLKKHVRLFLNYMPEDGDIAYTDGDRIYINLGAKFAARLKEKPSLFHTYVVGLLSHELGHIFWTEFEDGLNYMESIQKGTIYPSIPNHKNAQKFQNALSVVVNRQIFQQICHTIDNILEDIYVNALQAEMLGGLYSYGINLGNIMITEEMLSIEQQKETGYYDFNIIMNCLLTKLKSGSVIYGHYDVEYQDAVEDIEAIANKYIFKPTHKERVEGINLIICELWDLIEEMLEDIKQNASNNSGNGGNGSGTSDNNSGSSCGNSDSSDDTNEQNNDGSGGVSGGSSSNKSDNGDNEKDDKEGQQGASNGANSQEEDGDDSTSSGSSTSDKTEEDGDNTKSSNGTDGDKNRDTNGDSSGKSNSSSNKNEGEIDENLLKEILEKVIDQLQGQTQESQNQQDSNIAGKQQKVTPTTPTLDDSLKERLNKKVETGRFPISTGEAIAAEGNGKTLFEKLSPAEIEARSGLLKILDNLSEERAIQKNNEFVSQEMAQEVKDIDFGPLHKNINKTIYRVSEKNGKANYDILKKQITVTARKLETVIKRKIKEENLTGERRGLYFGKSLDTTKLYRIDAKLFKDRKQPRKEIDTAFYILVDVSASMWGQKIESARLSSILFAEVCENLNIPLEITGHSTVSGGIGLYNFINYNSLNKNQKFSLAHMGGVNSNRDGAAIIYGCERLLKRPEQKKVFIIISDGQPNDGSYYGEAAKSDMKHIKIKYEKAGIVFCAAAIDSDKEFIKAIFGKNFLNISHLESLPQTFGKILQNSVLND